MEGHLAVRQKSAILEDSSGRFVDDLEEVLELRGAWPILCPHNNHHGLLESVEPLDASKHPSRCFLEVEVVPAVGLGINDFDVRGIIASHKVMDGKAVL